MHVGRPLGKCSQHYTKSLPPHRKIEARFSRACSRLAAISVVWSYHSTVKRRATWPVYARRGKNTLASCASVINAPVIITNPVHWNWAKVAPQYMFLLTRLSIFTLLFLSSTSVALCLNWSVLHEARQSTFIVSHQSPPLTKCPPSSQFSSQRSTTTSCVLWP